MREENGYRYNEDGSFAIHSVGLDDYQIDLVRQALVEMIEAETMSAVGEEAEGAAEVAANQAEELIAVLDAAQPHRKWVWPA